MVIYPLDRTIQGLNNWGLHIYEFLNAFKVINCPCPSQPFVTNMSIPLRDHSKIEGGMVFSLAVLVVVFQLKYPHKLLLGFYTG